MDTNNNNAPGWPGLPPHWTSSAKEGLGTSLNPASHVWFTLSHGIFDEIYYPRVDQACTRDLGMIVTDGIDFFSEEKRDTHHEIAYLVRSIPAYRLKNTCLQGRYCIEKEIFTDPRRDAVLQRTRFNPLKGSLGDYHLYALLSPHIGNQGAQNTAWIGDYKGIPMLMAERDGKALSLACSVPWLKCSAGFVGASDGWQDLFQHKQMTWSYDRAEDGNVALTGEVDLLTSGGDFVLVLGFGTNWAEAGQRALATLLDGETGARQEYIREWQSFQHNMLPLGPPTSEENVQPPKLDLYHVSTTVLRIHEAKAFPGGIIASLSIPWGTIKGDNDLGGYHLVWPRDLVEAACGLLAVGASGDARRVLRYLAVTQEADGHWGQNMWLDGRSYWQGIQMDETAFPILLVDLALREKALKDGDIALYWPMVRKAAGYLAKNGPVTQQDRWEEDPGYSPFTLSVEIAALLAAANMADRNGESKLATYLRETADYWNECIERWIYYKDTDLAKQLGIEGYYVRVAPPDAAGASSPKGGYVPIKNRPPGQSEMPASKIVSPDALALVRFGLRAADDPRILNTIKVIDSLLKIDTPSGPCWHRYPDDGYGEKADGSPFDGIGIGRAWPLLTGERGHYELAAGRMDEAQRLLNAMEGFTNNGGLIPEQIWDAPDIPDKELLFGKPSGSAMPLVWAHAEYLKLLRSLRDGAVFDTPRQTVQRYLVEKQGSELAIWRFNQKIVSMPGGKTLRIEALAPAMIHWSADGWQTTADLDAQDTGFGIYTADLPTRELAEGVEIVFTFYWPLDNRWEGKDYKVRVKLL